MSRIGKMPITIPSGVRVSHSGGEVVVEGPKGKLQQRVSPEITVKIEENEVVLTRKDDSKPAKSMHGLYRTLVANMVQGVSNGFTKELELRGVGYRATLKGKDLDLALGFSHPVLFKAPEGILFTLNGNTKVAISGIDKALVGQVAADIRSIRPPEPYLGKGVRYAGEHVRRKAGKSAKK